MSKSLEFERRLQCRIHADVSLAHVGGTADLVCVVCEHQEAVRLRAEGAGLERQTDKYNERGECLTCGSSASCEHDDLGTGFTALAYVDSLKTAAQERDKLREQVAAQQAVVDAARDYRQSVIDMMHVMETGGDAWRMARERRVNAETRMFSGLAALDAAQATPPEGEQAR